MLTLFKLCPCLLILLLGTSSWAGETPSPRALTADLAWWDRQLVEQYRAVGEHGPWDAAAERFLRLLSNHYLNAPPYTAESEMSAMGMSVLEDGCRDPLLIVRTAMLYDGSGYGRSLIAWAIDLLRARNGTPKAYGAIHLLAAVRRQVQDPDPRKAKRARAELPGVLRAVLADLQRDPASSDAARRNLSITLNVLVDPEAVGSETAQAMRSLFAQPTVDPWLSNMMQGQAELNLAWAARGGRWSIKVPVDRQAGFIAHLAKARPLLTEAWKLRPDLAPAAAQMVSVAMGDQVDKPSLWAERALAADPENVQAYERLGTACQPRWGGSLEDRLALAKRAAAGPWDGPLPKLAEILVMNYFGELGDDIWSNGTLNSAVIGDKVWPILSAATAEHPGIPAATAAWRKTRRMAWLCVCSRKTEALATFTAAGGLDAPWLEPGAIPRLGTYPFFGPELALELHRDVAKQAKPVKRPLPRDSAPHRSASDPARRTGTLFADCYKRHGTHGPWDAKVAILVGPELAFHWYGDGKADPTWPTPSAILAMGCTDPLVSYLSHSVGTTMNTQDYIQALAKDWQALDDSAYPALIAYQPAWGLLRRLPSQERGRHQERYARLVARMAVQAGKQVPLAITIHELMQTPDKDPGSLVALSAAAAQPGVDPLLADALRGHVEVQQSLACANSDPQRRATAWRALARLWRVWDGTHLPLVASDMILAAGLAKCPDTEMRVWFDHAIDGAMDRNEPWEHLLIALAVNAEADGLLAMAQEIADLPASAGCLPRALSFLMAVIGNPSQHDAERVQQIWSIGDRVTTGLLAGRLSQDDIRQVLHQRAACAFLVGNRRETQAAVDRLGTDFDARLLPIGLDLERFQREISPSTKKPEGAPAGTSDF